MKFLLALSLLFTCEAFVPSSRFGVQTPTALNEQRGNASEAIKAAMEASRTFGGTSSEARVAWDIVEEINASDNSNAYKGDNNDTLSDPSKNKEMYDAFVKLRELGELQRSQVESIKLVTEQIRAVRIAPPAWNDEHEPNPMFDIALAEAKAMTEKHGLESSEAKLAWETLEDIAGNDSSAATKQAIDADEECLIEMMEACEAMDELNRALFLDKTKEDGRYHG